MGAQEEELKNKLKEIYFNGFDWTKQFGNIDLAVCAKNSDALFSHNISYLWAETKKSKNSDLVASFIQLILTIGREKTFQKELPPFFLGAADGSRIAFIDYSEVMDVFTKTDFNWNVTPSDHTTKEFKELYSRLKDCLSTRSTIFSYAHDEKNIKAFIKKNFHGNKNSNVKIPVTKTNFTYVFYDWIEKVKPSIFIDWQNFNKYGILDCDFFLADLMSKDNATIIDKLKVVLDKTKYKISQKFDAGGLFSYTDVPFRDGMRAHAQFWNIYERPPKQVYQKYILDRRDLLVSQYVRELKGSYYTPQKWVAKSHEYLEKVLGEDWQDEYYLWDCAGGTGNLVRGLTNKYNIFVSTLDESDVNIMHSKIADGSFNLVKENVFQFDFLNDEFTKCPDSLKEIISNPEKRKKLIILINPPYAEASSKTTVVGTGSNKELGAGDTMVYKKYQCMIGTAARELFAQFFIRIYMEISGCWLAEFSTLKILQASNFQKFRNVFRPKLVSLFLVPGNTFDNVTGKFPIGFHIWKTSETESFMEIDADVYSASNERLPDKHIAVNNDTPLIISWLRRYYDKESAPIGYLCMVGTDVQHSSNVFFTSRPSENDYKKKLFTYITPNNLIETSIYMVIRHVIEDTWLNDRDQFFEPAVKWKGDREFQVNCLVYALFDNVIQSKHGVNNWIPYTESDVNSPSTFKSRFMADYLRGKIKPAKKSTEYFSDIFSENEAETASEISPMEAMSDEARCVYDAGKEIWKYYMEFPGIDANASFYDIKRFFKGTHTDKKGKEVMNNTSTDEKFNALNNDLTSAMNDLAEKIKEKVYEYGFLK